MDGEEGRPEPRDLRRRALDRVGDVVQLEVDEDALARRRELRRQAQAAAIGELHADLIEARRVADSRDQPLGLGASGASSATISRSRGSMRFARRAGHGAPAFIRRPRGRGSISRSARRPIAHHAARRRRRSVGAIGPDPRRRQVAPDRRGAMGGIALRAGLARDRRGEAVGELDDHAVRSHQREGVLDQLQAQRGRLVEQRQARDDGGDRPAGEPGQACSADRRRRPGRPATGGKALRQQPAEAGVIFDQHEALAGDAAFDQRPGHRPGSRAELDDEAVAAADRPPAPSRARETAPTARRRRSGAGCRTTS